MRKVIQKLIQTDMKEEISFGVWLRKQRRAMGLTRQAFADQVGCAEVTLRRIEAGTLQPSFEISLGPLYFQKPECCTRLLGVIDKSGREYDLWLCPISKRYGARAEAHDRETLGDVGFEAAFAEGQKMSLDEAVDLALRTVEEM